MFPFTHVSNLFSYIFTFFVISILPITITLTSIHLSIRYFKSFPRTICNSIAIPTRSTLLIAINLNKLKSYFHLILFSLIILWTNSVLAQVTSFGAFSNFLYLYFHFLQRFYSFSFSFSLLSNLWSSPVLRIVFLKSVLFFIYDLLWFLVLSFCRSYPIYLLFFQLELFYVLPFKFSFCCGFSFSNVNLYFCTFWILINGCCNFFSF